MSDNLPPLPDSPVSPPTLADLAAFAGSPVATTNYADGSASLGVRASVPPVYDEDPHAGCLAVMAKQRERYEALLAAHYTELARSACLERQNARLVEHLGEIERLITSARDPMGGTPRAV